jgi:hypothetical protein
MMVITITAITGPAHFQLNHPLELELVCTYNGKVNIDLLWSFEPINSSDVGRFIVSLNANCRLIWDEMLNI